MIKTLDLNLGSMVIPNQLDPPEVGVPVVEPGQVLASGYYTEQTTGLQYYYDAPNDQWYLYAAGLLYPLAITWKPSPTPKIDLLPGDTLAIKLHFVYMGPAVTRTFYAALGTNKTSGSFSEWTEILGVEKWWVETPVDIAKKLAPAAVIQFIYLKIPVSTTIFGAHYGQDAACYCKIYNGFTLTEGQNCTPYYYDVCHVVALEGEFTEFGIIDFMKV